MVMHAFDSSYTSPQDFQDQDVPAQETKTELAHYPMDLDENCERKQWRRTKLVLL